MKKIAKTLKALPTSEIFQRILDPKDPVDDIIEELRAHWAYDLYERRPSPALLEGGALTPTDLDLACFISALVDRGAVINLPTYANRRQAHVRTGERLISKANRHGNVTGLTSNKDVFSFSVRILDSNVVRTLGDGSEKVGAFRNFMLVDLNGTWHDGWKTIEFAPSKKENEFIEENELIPGMKGNTIYFKNFVHPNRWVSFYGQWYLLTKVLIDRLKAEAKVLFQGVKALESTGVKLPNGSEAKSDEGGELVFAVGESDVVKVKAFEAEVDADVPSMYPTPDITDDSKRLEYLKLRLKKLRYNDVPALQFSIRTTELAFVNQARLFQVPDHVFSGQLKELGSALAQTPPFPGWVSGAKWEHGYKIKRTEWSRLVLTQPVPFLKGFALRYRTYWSKEKVSSDGA